jgi:cytochrome c oxidase subunit 4
MGTRAFLWTYLWLLAFTTLTFGLSFIHLGTLSVAMALVIAGIKGWLVAMFFMGLREHGTAARAALAVGVMLAALLIGFATADVATRDLPPRLSPAAGIAAVSDAPAQ